MTAPRCGGSGTRTNSECRTPMAPLTKVAPATSQSGQSRRATRCRLSPRMAIRPCRSSTPKVGTPGGAPRIRAGGCAGNSAPLRWSRPPVDERFELLGLEGLVQDGAGPEAGRALVEGRIAECRDQDDRDRAAALPQVLDGLQPGDPRHAEVGDHELRRPGVALAVLDPLQELGAVARLDDLVAGAP